MNRVDQFGEHSPPIRSSARVLWLRMLFSAMVGVCAALFSMWFMSVLIATGEQRLDQSKRVQMLDFVRVQSSETTQTKQRKPRKPEVAPPPDVPQAPASATPIGTAGYRGKRTAGDGTNRSRRFRNWLKFW